MKIKYSSPAYHRHHRTFLGITVSEIKYVFRGFCETTADLYHDTCFAHRLTMYDALIDT